MTNLGILLLSSHALYVTLTVVCFFTVLLGVDDELHQYAVNKSLKLSVVITVLALLGYGFYMLACGNDTISIHILFFVIEALSILTLLLYYIELKGFSLSLKIKSKNAGSFLAILSIGISVITILSLVLRFKLFANPAGFIRYDELLLYINAIFFVLLIPFLPKIKQKLNREVYKQKEKELNKIFSSFIVVNSLFMLALIAYVIYLKAIL